MSMMLRGLSSIGLWRGRLDFLWLFLDIHLRWLFFSAHRRFRGILACIVIYRGQESENQYRMRVQGIISEFKARKSFSLSRACDHDAPLGEWCSQLTSTPCIPSMAEARVMMVKGAQMRRIRRVASGSQFMAICGVRVLLLLLSSYGFGLQRFAITMRHWYDSGVR